MVVKSSNPSNHPWFVIRSGRNKMATWHDYFLEHEVVEMHFEFLHELVAFSHPFEKYESQIGSFPQGSGWKQKIFELPPASSKLLQNGKMGVSKNRGTPKSSILIGFSIINHPFWGTPIFGNTQMDTEFDIHKGHERNLPQWQIHIFLTTSMDHYNPWRKQVTLNIIRCNILTINCINSCLKKRTKSHTSEKIVLAKEIHPQKQTWNLKMDPWKRRFLLETHHFQVPC